VIGWISCSIAIYAVLFFIGKLLFHQWPAALISLAVAAVSGYILCKSISKVHFLEHESRKEPLSSPSLNLSLNEQSGGNK
jgi:hypothetical protein